VTRWFVEEDSGFRKDSENALAHCSGVVYGIQIRGTAGLKQLGKTRIAVREQIVQTLKTGWVYVLDPNKKFSPKPTSRPVSTPTQEYGLS